VLACLTDEDGAMVTRLSRLSLMEQSRLTRIIDQMAEKGLVLRAPDPVDARRVRVYLTQKGRDLALCLVADARQHEAGILALLPPDESDAVKPVLKALLARLDDGAAG
jgi:DNA-binding MarR family transcriptional regulator